MKQYKRDPKHSDNSPEPKPRPFLLFAFSFNLWMLSGDQQVQVKLLTHNFQAQIKLLTHNFQAQQIFQGYQAKALMPPNAGVAKPSRFGCLATRRTQGGLLELKEGGRPRGAGDHTGKKPSGADSPFKTKRSPGRQEQLPGEGRGHGGTGRAERPSPRAKARLNRRRRGTETKRAEEKRSSPRWFCSNHGTQPPRGTF
ncbi:hypothetical protein EYF80_048494 [Liparis tanakae]|uniref:Uncharacterized protein n=1 Tax=Liparis tanakae TaxID=230148 RepID=A0A4Z2FK57_9TELE|nr:hypothetical protein EYF80_048494 [Liparis tanakae]